MPRPLRGLESWGAPGRMVWAGLMGASPTSMAPWCVLSRAIPSWSAHTPRAAQHGGRVNLSSRSRSFCPAHYRHHDVAPFPEPLLPSFRHSPTSFQLPSSPQGEKHTDLRGRASPQSTSSLLRALLPMTARKRHI